MKNLHVKPKHRYIAIALLICFSYQIIFPTVAFALTGGPSQPEVESFEPIGTSEMVDLFSGDFNYNIPLLDIDGYPINIAYHSGVTMDQEASWVGLGWNLNPGVINRNMRGIPDDFNGDAISKIQYVKPDKSFGVNIGAQFELFGRDKNIGKFATMLRKFGLKTTLELSLGINYNNYKGLGIESRISPAISAGDKTKGNLLNKIGFSARLDIASSSKDGFSIRPQVGMQPALFKSDKMTLSNNTSIGMMVSSRGGVKSLSIQSGLSASATKRTTKDAKGNALKESEIETQTSQLGSITNGGGTITFGTQTYTPSVGMEFSNMNVSLRAKLGIEIKGVNPNFTTSGYFSSQEIVSTKLERGAYGTMYLQNKNSESAMLDFNREKDGSYSEKNPILAIPIQTYDLFSASGQGVGGMFKPYRSDLPVMGDPYMKNVSKGRNVGAEVGLGGYWKAGLNPSINHTEVVSKPWGHENDLLSKFYYKQESKDEPMYEPVYFKNVGEKAAVDATTIPYHLIQNGALRPSLGEIAPILGSKKVFLKRDILEGRSGGHHYEVNINNLGTVKTSKEKRNQLFSYLTVGERAYCLQEFLNQTPYESENTSTVYRNEGERKNSHLTEITITNDQGSRYVYGVAAYNHVQYDVSFTNALDPDDPGQNLPSVDCGIGQVAYSGIDFDNPDFKNRPLKGNDHGLNVTKTPGYAHSYLLTAVLSPDYIDNDVYPGPSEGDYGNYTSLTYDRVSANYKWRVPYKENYANYNEGLKSDKTDDNANLMYGEKEIWLVKTISGRHHHAIFYKSPRKDGLGVTGINGGKDFSQVSYKLDSIVLYSNSDKKRIKGVHFEYDYQLCQGIDNSVDNSGKLTLTKVYFTYGSSTKGRFNSYVFKYDPNNNPNYHLKAYDRWGNYKPYYSGCNSDTKASSLDFPYTDQNSKLSADAYAASWSLTSIELPSGGIIKIKYESDDYAYVQDKRAMQMVKLKGFGDYSTTLAGAHYSTFESLNLECTNKLYDNKDANEVIYFELPEAVNGQAPEQLRLGLLNDYKALYYNCLVDLYNEDKHFEYIRGYTEIEDAGVVNMGQSTKPIGWIKMKALDKDYQPIAKTAWQYARMYMPQIVYPGSNLRNKADQGSGETAKAIIKGLLGFIFDAAEMINGINDKLRRQEKGRTVDLANSWIRVNNLTGVKFGGGVRVKQIEMDDQWSQITGVNTIENMSYGQVYEYTTKAYYNGIEQEISSGVASYEPGIGGDENPFKQPVAYSKDNIGVPSDEFYSEEPFGEAYFPSPSVGYSRVTVKPLLPQGFGGSSNGTGKVVHEFYTAKEFPTLTSRTGINPIQHTSSPIFKLIGFKMEDHMAATQGFQIELNDMHGKQKSVSNYSQAKINSNNPDDAYSSVSYEYAVEDDKAPVKKLSNVFKVVDANHTITEKQIGVESEMILDTRQQRSETYAGGISLNLDVVKVLGAPVPFFTGWPDFSSEITSFRSAVLMRIVNRFGIVKRTIATEEGASIATENILLDAETGQTILTRTYNEFKDPVYNTTIPAHWAYEGMSQAYKNNGVVLNITQNTTLGFGALIQGQNVDPSPYVFPGDKIVLNYTSDGSHPNQEVCWVHKNSTGKWVLLDKNGVPKTLNSGSAYSIKVIASGRKNMQNVPIASVSAMSSPIVNNANNSGLVLATNQSNVIAASASQYNNWWKVGNNDNYNNTIVGCDSLYVIYNAHSTSMKNEFRSHLVPLILSKYPSITQTLPDQYGRTSFSDMVLIDSTEILQSLPSSSKLKQFLNLYTTCQNSFPEIKCSINRSLRLLYNNNPQHSFPYTPGGPYAKWYTHNSVTMAYVIKISLEIGKYNFGVPNYVVKRYADFPKSEITNYITNNPCYYLDGYKTSSFSGKPDFDGSGQNLNNLVLDGLVWPSVAVSSSYVAAKLRYPFFGGTKYTYNGSTSSADFTITYRPYFDSTYLQWTYLSWEDLTIPRCPAPTGIGGVPFSTGISQTITNLWNQYPTAKNKTLYFLASDPGITRSHIERAAEPGYANYNVLFSMDPIPPPPCAFMMTNAIVNPYLNGILGNWYPSKNWAYLTSRTSNSDIRKDGAFVSYAPFWKLPNSSNPKMWADPNQDWVMQSELTKYSRFGSAIESKDALNRFTSQLYNESNGLVTAVANNAKYTQLAFDDMEMYIDGTGTNCAFGHFNFLDNKPRTSKDAHSGKQSILVPKASANGVETYRELEVNDPSPIDDANGYRLRLNDFNGQFNPSNGKYVVSAWIKIGNNRKATSYFDAASSLNPNISVFMESVTLNPTTVTTTHIVTFYPTGPIIEGWQKIEGVVDLQNTGNTFTRVKVRLQAARKTTDPDNTLFDDLRIHPFNSSMKSYVYDKQNKRLMATLDENNYATFYEYDAEGKLLRIKKETEKGIVTVKESRGQQHKKGL
ncbi:MAG: hypothetical protein MUE96_08105 [Bacteroidia bacterium]|jgi:hypothetical protein|nr:hypothetical protein [Bacteroidia bacterium]